MIISIAIPDSTYLAYEHRTGSPNDARKAIAKLAEKFQDFGEADRAVVLPDEVRRRLEVLYGTTIDDPHRFVEWLERALGMEVGGVMVSISAAQRKRLESDAARIGVKPNEMLTSAIKRLAATALGGA